MDGSDAGETGHAPGFGARRGMSFKDRLRAEESYGVLLVLILATLLAAALSGRAVGGRIVAIALQGGVLLFALWTSRADRGLVRIALVVVPVVVVAAAVLTGKESDAARGAVSAANAALALGAIVAIIRRLGGHPRVDSATILGALSTYLLIGMFFAAVYATVAAFGNAEFFVQGVDPHGVDFLYFSFVTMTTVGYGDLTAAEDLGRMLAVTEALIGQLYLVTVVALVIGNIGRERRRG
jgi:hypothetical protein